MTESELMRALAAWPNCDRLATLAALVEAERRTVAAIAGGRYAISDAELLSFRDELTP